MFWVTSRPRYIYGFPQAPKDVPVAFPYHPFMESFWKVKGISEFDFQKHSSKPSLWSWNSMLPLVSSLPTMKFPETLKCTGFPAPIKEDSGKMQQILDKHPLPTCNYNYTNDIHWRPKPIIISVLHLPSDSLCHLCPGN